ncbi:hypothetical protein GEMRC1_007318 [Eukaryota sp. GEM-RC1]
MNPDVWESLFPASVTETPQRTLFSLPLGVRKFQKKFVSFHESLDYTNCISLAKVKSPAFCAFLQDMSSDSASTFITQLPGRFIFNLKDHEWLVNMRLRLGFWPFGLIQNSTCICKNKHKASFHHLVNCSKFIHCRSILHNSLRDTCLEMFKANGFHGKVEPLLSHLSDHPDSTQKRGDFIGPWLSCQEIVVDFTTVDPCKASAIANILNPSNDPLKDAENAKVSKYGHQVAALNSRRHNNIVFQPFAVSLYGNFGSSTKEFLSLFENLCSELGKKFNRSYWKSKFAFSIFRSMYRYVDSILSKLFGGNYFSELGSSFDNLF